MAGVHGDRPIRIFRQRASLPSGAGGAAPWVRGLVFIMFGWAAGGEAAAMTLDEYVREVIQTHPAVLQHLHQYRQVVQDTQVARKGWYPKVDVGASTGVYSTTSPITNQERRDYDSSRVSLTVTQNLFKGFETIHQVDQTEARLQSAAWRLYDETDNIALAAIKAYLDVLKQKRLLELAQNNVESHERTARQVKERTDAGMGRRSEVEQSEGRLARAWAGYVAQQNNFQDAQTQMHRFLGRYVSVDELTDVAPPARMDGTLEEAIDRAVRTHPAVRSALMNVQAAQAEYKRSRSANYPSIDLQLQSLGGKDLSGYDGRTREHSATLNLTYNLFNGGADLAERRKRASAVFENNEFANRARRDAIEALRLSWMADVALTEQQGHLERQVERTGRTVESYREEFFLGRRDLLDLLDAENEYNEARKSFNQARYDGVAARYRVQEGVGALYAAVGLDVTVTGDGIQALRANRSEVDVLPYTRDRDRDRKTDRHDHCDNSLSTEQVDRYGCARQLDWQVLTVKSPEVEIAPNGDTAVTDLRFVFDRAELTPESEERMEEIIRSLRQVQATTIEIYAHADGRGKPAYNLALSERRARAIRDRLLQAGFDADQLKAYGKGSAEPIADDNTDEGRALNRRVVFRVVSGPK